MNNLRRRKTEKKTPIKGEPKDKPIVVKEVKQEIKKEIKEIPCSQCGKSRPLANKSKKICGVCVKKNSVEKAKKRRQVKRERKAESISVLTKKLDRIFSIYVRLKYADNQGNVKCFTCDNTHHYKSIQNGHFQSRRYMSTRFHENNCRPQCYACNVGLHGQQYIFGANLDREICSGTAETMVLLSKQTKKFSSLELRELIDDYTRKVDNLKLQKGIFD